MKKKKPEGSLYIMNTEDQLRSDLQQALMLPHGRERLEALTELIQRADLLQLHDWRRLLRKQSAAEHMFHGDPGKVFPLVAEYVALYEEQAQPGQDDSLIFMVDYGMEVLNYLPQIPLAQAEALMERFEELLRFQKRGLRCFYQRAFLFYRHIDTVKALEFFDKFQKTRRDFFSDCRACEQGDMVRLFLQMGDMNRAAALAEPIWEGDLKCHNIPRLIWQIYLHRALDSGDWKQAASLAESLFHASDPADPSDLDYVAAVLRCWALTDLPRGMELLKRCLAQWHPLWDQDKWFAFLMGAWCCCRMQAEQSELIALQVPRSAPFWQADGCYSLSGLAEWFYAAAQKIARQFDQRNGTCHYISRLEQTELSIKYQGGRNFWPVVKL